MPTQVFERHEKKYLLAPQQFAPLYAHLLARFVPDEYGRHTICTLYLDTPYDACAHRQAEKTDFREKLRLRSYGVPAAGDTVYLELKKKLDGVTYKRRTALPLAEAEAYLSCGTVPQNAGQVFGEVDWFIKRHALCPKSVICYDRVALHGKEDTELRITFDENIRYRGVALALSHGDWGLPLCNAGSVLMEVKIAGAMPLWLAHIFSAHGVYPASFSKFRKAYEAGLARKAELFQTPPPWPQKRHKTWALPLPT